MARQRGLAVRACLSLVFGVQVGLKAQLVRVLMANSCCSGRVLLDSSTRD